MDTDHFSSILTKWGEWLTTGRIFMARLEDDDVRGITKSALIFLSLDDGHPMYMSERLHSLLPNSELVDYANWFNPDELTGLEEGLDFHKKAVIAPIIDDFIQRVEKGEA